MIKTSRKGAFTLIELLVVISIIALLAGLAFPALNGAIDAAQRTQASTMCNQLSIAITLYNTEYGIWPTTSNNTGSNQFTTSTQVGDLCFTLNGCRPLNPKSGTTVTLNAANPRGIQFMSFNTKDLVGSGNEIQNPYKKANNRQYWIYTDGDNYDGVVTGIPDIANGSATGGATTAGVAIWAWGDKTGTVKKFVSSYK